MEIAEDLDMLMLRIKSKNYTVETLIRNKCVNVRDIINFDTNQMLMFILERSLFFDLRMILSCHCTGVDFPATNGCRTVFLKCPHPLLTYLN